MNNTDTSFKYKKILNCGGKLIDISEPIVMGILNITLDSFYDGGKYITEKEILIKAENILKEGGKIIDIGAYSSRPGAKNISEDEELERLFDALKHIRKEFPETIISVDTFRSNVAKRVVNEFAVSIINDISAGNMDENMFKTISELNVVYIMMHMQGNPQNMQNNPVYDDIMKDIILYFAEKIEKLKSLGFNNIILDPGFGFGKTLNHNYILLNNLEVLKNFELPFMVGISRKSMIYKLLNTTPEKSLTGTIVLNTIALESGVNILRVHDVQEAVETINLYKKIKETKNKDN
ncbi:MAG: dihydropteroate synthase [Bacteroidales bacterium]|nr:dihydropteroate synthase [Bacteroidales bacterium]